MRALIILFCALALPACGDYVDYDGQAPHAAPEVIAGGAEQLDEETRKAFATTQHLDHLVLEGLLGRFVTTSADGDFTYLDYKGIAASAEATFQLNQYLSVLDLVHPDQLADQDERLAYWINAYNAGVIFGVIKDFEGDPTWSVSQDAFAFFDRSGYRFAGLSLTLNQIEHGIIRGDWAHNSLASADAEQLDKLRALHASLWGDNTPDARIHVALNCASLGCPNLPGKSPFAFRATTLDAQLDAAAREFANNVQKGAGPDGISPLFDWYKPDFVAGYGSVEEFLMTHRDGIDGVSLASRLTYNWTLNIVP